MCRRDIQTHAIPFLWCFSWFWLTCLHTHNIHNMHHILLCTPPDRFTFQMHGILGSTTLDRETMLQHPYRQPCDHCNIDTKTKTAIRQLCFIPFFIFYRCVFSNSLGCFVLAKILHASINSI